MQSKIATTGFGPAVRISACHGRLEFLVDIGFREFVTSHLMVDADKTVGQKNIDWLHDMLDEWIANHING